MSPRPAPPGLADRQFAQPRVIPPDKAIHTKALINAIEVGIIHTIGNPEFDIDFESVVKTAYPLKIQKSQKLP